MAYLIGLGFEDPEELSQIAFTGVVCTIDTSPDSRTGNRRLKIMSNSNANGRFEWAHNPTDIFFSGALRAEMAPTDNYRCIEFGTGAAGNAFANALYVRYRTGNTMEIVRGTTVLAASAIGVFNPLNAWAHIQAWLHPDNSPNGRFLVKIDDTTVIDFTGDTTDSNAYCNGVGLFTCINSSGNGTYWDDVRINDNSGAQNNSYPGLARLQPIRVIGAGENTGLSRGGIDLGANFRQVRDPDDFQSFLQGALNTYDLYTVDVPDLPVGATINNIITGVSGKTVSGSGVVAPLVRGATTLGTGSDYALTAIGRNINEAWPLNPDDSAAWEEADLANLQIGVKVRS